MEKTSSHGVVRRGDRVRVTFEGTVSSRGVLHDGESHRSLHLVLDRDDPDSPDARLNWSVEPGVEPMIEVLATTYAPGDVALITIGGGIELLMFRVESKGEGGYWIQPTGRKWFDEFAPDRVQVLHTSAEMVTEAL